MSCFVKLSSLMFCFDVPPERCRFCLGTGTVTVELGGGEEEFSRCINREGVGTLTCTACLKAPGNSLDISTAGNDFILSDP